MVTLDTWPRTELFADVDDDALAAAVDRLPAVALGAGDEFLLADHDVVCCVVTEGRLALTVFAEENRERTIGILEQGDVLVRPIEGLGASGPHVRCFADDRARLSLVHRDRLADWMRVPELAAGLFRVLAAQIADRELAVAIASSRGSSGACC